MASSKPKTVGEYLDYLSRARHEFPRTLYIIPQSIDDVETEKDNEIADLPLHEYKKHEDMRNFLNPFILNALADPKYLDDFDKEGSPDGKLVHYTWTRQEHPDKRNVCTQQYVPPKRRLKGLSPSQKFTFYFNKELLWTIAEESRIHAERNGIYFTTTLLELQNFLGIYILTTPGMIPLEEILWGPPEGGKYKRAMEDAMESERFAEIFQRLRFADYKELDKKDKYSKIRPVIDFLNKKFAETYPMDEDMSFGETPIEYFGYYGSDKQHIKQKPISFGYKAWCLTDKQGYLFRFDLSKGDVPEEYSNIFGEGGGAFIRLILDLPCHMSNLPLKFWFDKSIVSVPLICYLGGSKFGGIGMLEDKKIPKDCPLMSREEMRRLKKGAIDKINDLYHGISVVRLADENITFVSTKVSLEDVPTKLEANTLGIGKLVDNISCYRLALRKNVWWWSIFSWMVDAALQNSWLLHKKERPDIDLLKFKRQVALGLLNEIPKYIEDDLFVEDPRYDEVSSDSFSETCSDSSMNDSDYSWANEF